MAIARYCWFQPAQAGRYSKCNPLFEGRCHKNHRGLAGFQPISSSTIHIHICIYPFQISKCVNSSQHKLESIWISDWAISWSVTWRLGSKRKYVFEWYRIHLSNPFIAPRVGDYGCYPQVSPAVCRGRLGGWAPFIGTSGILVSYLVSLAGSRGKMFWIFVILRCYAAMLYLEDAEDA